MNTRTKPATYTTLAALLLVSTPALFAESDTTDMGVQRDNPSYGQQSQTDSTSEIKDSALSSARRHARDARGSYSGDLIGMDVLGSDQTKLGTVHDFVIDSQSGRVVHAVISSGGVLGVGSTLRVVPLSALSQSGDRMTLNNVDQTKWEQAPVFTKDQLRSLNQNERSRQVYDYFGQKPDTSAKNQQFTLATNLRGKNLTNSEQKIGEIEDVIISLQSRSAGALIDPNDDFVGSDQKFVVPLNRLGNLQQASVSTSLTREDFARVAQPADTRSNWDMGSIFAWPYGNQAARDASPRLSQRDTRTNSDPLSDSQSKGAPPVAAIRRAVEADARTLGVSSNNIQVSTDKDKIVLRGTVPNQAAKEGVEDRAEKAAPGWNVDNQLKVSSSDDM